MRLGELIKQRLIGAACGAAGVIGMVLIMGIQQEQDYQDALRAQQQAQEARADAIAQRRAAMRDRQRAEASLRLVEIRKGDARGGEWR